MAQDIGNSDGSVSNIQDRNTNRGEIKYTVPVTVPGFQQLQLIIDAANIFPQPVFRQYILKGVLDDSILAVLFIGEQEIGDILNIAKPPHLRKTRLDGETVNEIEYTYISVNERIRTQTINGNIIKDIQFIEPPYVPGFDDGGADILYAQDVETTGVEEAPFLIDMNLEARRWSTPVALKRYVVLSIDDDTMEVQDVTTGDSITVARSPELQRSAFDGQQIGIFSYEYQSAIEREVTDTEGPDTEAQVIIPQFDLGKTIIYVMEAQGGTGVTTLVDGFTTDVLLIDVNTGGRMWATAP